jgi:cephalosporin hydroxylase
VALRRVLGFRRMFESRFQTFTESADPSHGKARLSALRKELSQRKLDGFIVPRSDEQQNEYVPACAERLAWLTGFTGSAGTAIVLAKKAAVFVDGRYTLQVGEQIDVKIFAPVAIADLSPEKWLERHAGKAARIGYDASLHTRAQVKRLAAAVERAGAELVALDSNHTHDHVLGELRAYAPLASRGSYCVVFDTVIEHLPRDFFPDRPWNPGDSPKTAIDAFQEECRAKRTVGVDGAPLELVIDRDVESKLLVTAAPGGFLKRG